MLILDIFNALLRSGNLVRLMLGPWLIGHDAAQIVHKGVVGLSSRSRKNEAMPVRKSQALVEMGLTVKVSGT